MHTLHFDPRQRLLVGLVALVVTLVLMFVAAAPLGQLDLAPDGGSGGVGSAPAAPTFEPGAISRDTARWVTDPLAPPLEFLVRRAGE
jgi:hypothetical protein